MKLAFTILLWVATFLLGVFVGLFVKIYIIRRRTGISK